jgi:hypothetical protein
MRAEITAVAGLASFTIPTGFVKSLQCVQREHPRESAAGLS